MDDLKAKQEAFDAYVKAVTAKLDMRTRNVERAENDIHLKDNEFKRIAEELKKREDDVEKLIEQAIEFSTGVLERSL